MSLSSMTGFARRDGVEATPRWTWELRSVNGRGLDVRLRLPPGFEAVDVPARASIGRALIRGSVTANLTVEMPSAGGAGVRLNERALASVLEAAEQVRLRIGGAPPSVEGLLALRGVLEPAEAEADPDAHARLESAVLAGLEAALVELVAARRGEGAAVAGIVAGQLDAIEALARRAAAAEGRRPEAIRARLAEQVRRLVDASPALDAERLHQEAVLIATRADVQEEIDRLTAHVGQGRALIAEGGAVGRRLDFLAQEFGREANTLCSKANDAELTRIGLELKAVIDQLREQVQNLE
jgi:uncharacterized protein (TIGR00255 family)